MSAVVRVTIVVYLDKINIIEELGKSRDVRMWR